MCEEVAMSKRTGGSKGFGTRGGLGARVGYEVMAVVLDMLADGWPRKEIVRLSGVSREYVRKVDVILGGVYRPRNSDYDPRYLDRDERYELARLNDGCLSVREIGRRMGRDPSTISRELRRNLDPRTGRYLPEKAHRLAWERQRRPKQSKIGGDPQLKAQVQQLLDKRLSPDQVAGRLKVLFADNQQMRISHESIYRSIYVYPRGEVARELKATLRSGRTVRRPRGQRRGPGGSRIIGAVSIAERPEEVEGRKIPGHHEGDLIIGAIGTGSAVATIVERTSGYLVLGYLPNGRGAESVCDAVAEAMSVYPVDLAKTLTWDRGTEMANHAELTKRTGIDVYFADPYSPWQRGSNENINGLLREYLPKSTDLSVHSAADLNAIAAELNDRPRKRLGYLTPAEVLASIQAKDQGVATTA
jgi:transposase, IS30 family